MDHKHQHKGKELLLFAELLRKREKKRLCCLYLLICFTQSLFVDYTVCLSSCICDNNIVHVAALFY